MNSFQLLDNKLNWFIMIIRFLVIRIRRLNICKNLPEVRQGFAPPLAGFLVLKSTLTREFRITLLNQEVVGKSSDFYRRF
ncbi:MAG: hypothetical protein A2152_01995 [Candidatus Levybacteria bacterium RBG_16_35_6]|nr:MAG: hypothetical protein A2152_01995 [Candidatus Levybacteria bacterium RBG_16_35_6]